MPLSGPEGNPKTTTFTGMGCLIFSSGEPHFTELTLIASAGLVLDWVQEVAMTPEGEDYANPKFDIVYTDPVTVTDPDWSHWKEGEAEGEMDDKDDEESQIKMEPVEAHGKGSEQSGLVLLTRPDSS